MCLAEHVVVGVVGRSNLQASRSELDIHISVLNHRDYTSHQRHNHLLALEPLVLGVLGVDTHGSIAHDSLRTCGGNHCIVSLFVLVDYITFSGILDVGAVTFLCHIIFQMVEFRLFILIHHLLVAECSLSLRVPVHHTQSTIDESLVVEIHKHLDDALRTSLVHCEGSAVPVA